MKCVVTVLTAIVSLFSFAAPGSAQQYPNRNVTLIVPYPAGGPTDALARQLAPILSAKLGHTFVVENVSGGGTIIATQRVARATPDGHTLLLHNLQISANVSLYPSLPFDTEKDLAPIMFINNNPLVLVGRKSLAPNSAKELIDYGQKNTLKVAHPGVGATGHLASNLTAQEAKIKMDLIPYRGAAPALQDIIGGHVDLFYATPQSVVQQVADGQIKAYGITAKERSPQLPNVPSFVAELGPKLEILYWHALFAPAGTPDAIVDKINATVREIIADPAILKNWDETGVAPYAKDQQTVAAAKAILSSEIKRWGQVVKDNNIQLSQ